MYNNALSISGVLECEFSLDHYYENEKFYKNYLSVTRTSGAIDVIPVIISESMIEKDQSYKGKLVYIRGQFRSFNRHEADRTHLDLYIFPESIQIVDECYHENDVFLEGFICNQPISRETPNGRIIADVILAVNRYYGKSDYIPVILWGRNAYSVSHLRTGDCIRVAGRAQSRTYTKDGEIRTVYEISTSKYEAVY